MKSADRRKIKWFKALYKSTLYVDERIEDLNTQLKELDRMVELKSPNLSGVQVLPAPRDMILAEYVDRKSEIEYEIEACNTQKRICKEIVEKMPKKIVSAMHNVYTFRSTLESEAYKMHVSPRTLYNMIDKAILKAL